MATLKITDTALATLRAAVAPLDTPELRERYRARDFPRAERVRDLNKRYRWDLLTAAVPAREVCDLYAQGLTDVHIDSALRAIVPAL